MDMKAAVLRETKGKLSVENISIDSPKTGEVLVKIVASVRLFGVLNPPNNYAFFPILAQNKGTFKNS